MLALMTSVRHANGSIGQFADVDGSPPATAAYTVDVLDLMGMDWNVSAMKRS